MIKPFSKKYQFFSKPQFWFWALAIFIPLLVALIVYFHYQAQAIETELNHL
ncbi:protein BatD [Emticicia sp. C21]|uniref:protein BatD n=1 Tax=Emticicia sp. C21 TaxID=2302915 RepID=UPI0011C1114B|nr:protein BatD [Emticicia sp. C21]